MGKFLLLPTSYREPLLGAVSQRKRPHLEKNYYSKPGYQYLIDEGGAE